MDHSSLAQDVLDRFLRYAVVDTMSNESLAETRHPSTDSQWDLLHLLEKELKEELKIKDVELDGNGILIARIPSNVQKSCQTIGLMAHVDTADDVMGNSVKPRVIDSYEGGDVKLNDKCTLLEKDNPQLSQYKGQTIIVTDGNTLLGSDDKAGVAEIMAAAKLMVTDPDFKHGPVELYFTADEETGCGMDKFPYDKIKCDYCYTIDGGDRYCIEAECFNAAVARLTFHGISYHTGSGRGRIINAVTLVSAFVTALPQAESPEATDGRYGFYCPLEITGALAETHLNILLRDFDLPKLNHRIEVVKSLARTLEQVYPGARIDVEIKNQYYNMIEEARKKPEALASVYQAGKELGMPLYESLIRGGTDGSRMANERHIPCPNLFTGGHNLHSVYEWAALPAMEDSARLISCIIALGAKD